MSEIPTPLREPNPDDENARKLFELSSKIIDLKHEIFVTLAGQDVLLRHMDRREIEDNAIAALTDEEKSRHIAMRNEAIQQGTLAYDEDEGLIEQIGDSLEDATSHAAGNAHGYQLSVYGPGEVELFKPDDANQSFHIVFNDGLIVINDGDINQDSLEISISEINIMLQKATEYMQSLKGMSKKEIQQALQDVTSLERSKAKSKFIKTADTKESTSDLENQYSNENGEFHESISNENKELIKSIRSMIELSVVGKAASDRGWRRYEESVVEEGSLVVTRRIAIKEPDEDAKEDYGQNVGAWCYFTQKTISFIIVDEGVKFVERIKKLEIDFDGLSSLWDQSSVYDLDRDVITGKFTLKNVPTERQMELMSDLNSIDPKIISKAEHKLTYGEAEYSGESTPTMADFIEVEEAIKDMLYGGSNDGNL